MPIPGQPPPPPAQLPQQNIQRATIVNMVNNTDNAMNQKSKIASTSQYSQQNNVLTQQQQIQNSMTSSMTRNVTTTNSSNQNNQNAGQQQQQQRQLLYSFHIFYRGRKCLFSAGDYDENSEDLLYGLLVTLKSFSEQVGNGRQKNKTNQPQMSQQKKTSSQGLVLGQSQSSNTKTTNQLGQQQQVQQKQSQLSNRTCPPFQTFNSYTTPNYKLHCLEIPTGYWFICTTPASALLDMRDYLRQIYQELFVPLVLRNPQWDVVSNTTQTQSQSKSHNRVSQSSRFAGEVRAFFKRLNGQNYVSSTESAELQQVGPNSSNANLKTTTSPGTAATITNPISVGVKTTPQKHSSNKDSHDFLKQKMEQQMQQKRQQQQQQAKPQISSNQVTSKAAGDRVTPTTDIASVNRMTGAESPKMGTVPSDSASTMRGTSTGAPGPQQVVDRL